MCEKKKKRDKSKDEIKIVATTRSIDLCSRESPSPRCEKRIDSQNRRASRSTPSSSLLLRSGVSLASQPAFPPPPPPPPFLKSPSQKKDLSRIRDFFPRLLCPRNTPVVLEMTVISLPMGSIPRRGRDGGTKLTFSPAKPSPALSVEVEDLAGMSASCADGRKSNSRTVRRRGVPRREE